MLDNIKPRSGTFFLTFVLFVSVLAMPLTGTVAASHGDAAITEGSDYEQGMQLHYSTGTQGDTVYLVQDGNQVATYTVDSNGEVLVDTTEDDNGTPMEGSYSLEDSGGATLVNFSVVDSSQYEEITASNYVYWFGQTLTFDNQSNFNSGEEVILRVGGDGDDEGEFVKQYIVQSAGDEIVINTDNQNLEGRYTIHDGSGTQVGSFEVVKQSFSVSAEDKQLSNDSGGDKDTVFDIDSNRSGYTVQVTEANGKLSAEEIRTVFSGSVSKTDDAVISMDPSTKGKNSTHTLTADVSDHDGDSLNSVSVNYGSTDADISNVGTGDVIKVGIDEGGDDPGDVTDVNVSGDLNSASASNNGHTITFGFGGSHTLSAGDEIVIVYEDVQNPSVQSAADVSVDINPQSAGDELTASLFTDDTDDEGAAYFRIGHKEGLDANFSSVENGSYKFNFEVVDTGVSDTTDVGVDAGGDVSVELSQSVYNEHQGDVVTVTVNTDGVSQFDITFGDWESDNYSQTATVDVDDDVSEVKLQFNTYNAGIGAKPWSVHEDSKNDASLSQSRDFDLSGNQPIDKGDYDVEVSISGETQDTGLVTLEEGTLDGATTHVAPKESSINELEDLDVATEGNTVAMNDKFVFQVEASGVYGFIDEDTTAADLAKSEGDKSVNGSSEFSEAPTNLGEIHSQMETTDSGAYIITNVYELQAMNHDPSADYVLGNDIDASATSNWNGGSGFKPVWGGGYYTRFSGTLDGKGHTISGLTINRPTTKYVGLIGKSTSSGSVQQLTLENVSITGRMSVGAVAGESWGKISDVTVSGDVTATGYGFVGGVAGDSSGALESIHSRATVTGAKNVGGVVGAASGGIEDSKASGTVIVSDSSGDPFNVAHIGGLAGKTISTVKNSRATGEIRLDISYDASGGTGDFGGLVGQAGPVKNSYANVDINSGSFNVVGGLVGQSNGAVYNSYAMSDISSSGNKIGGLVGYSSGELKRSYAAGKVSGSSTVGGLIGVKGEWSGPNSQLYWDTESTGQSSGIGKNETSSTNVVGLTTSEMQGSSASTNMTFTDSNGNSLWKVNGGNVWVEVTRGYPDLVGMERPSDDNPAGVYIEIKETEPGMNQEAKTLDVAKGTLIENPKNDTFYIVFDQSDFPDVEADDEFSMTFYQTEKSVYVEDSNGGENSEEVSSNVTFVERDYTFNNMNDEGVVEVPAQTESKITGTTTVAPGTEVTVLAQSGSPNSFAKLSNVEVTEDRTFATTFNLSNANSGQEFGLELDGEGKTADSIVVDSTQESTSDVMVNVENSAGEPVEADVTIDGRTKTATEGTATFDLTKGEYTVDASADGYLNAGQTLTVEGETSTTLTLEEVQTVDYTVTVQNSDGEAVSGASVTVDGQTKTTGSSGQATFTLEEGSYTAQVSANGYLNTSSSITASSDSTSTTVSLTAEQTGEVYTQTFTVEDADGEPVSGATVEFGDQTKTTDGNGEVTFTTSEGDYDVAVSAEGYQDASETVTVSGDSSSTLTLTTSDDGDGDSQDDGNGDSEGGLPLGLIAVVVILALLGVGGYFYDQNQE